MRFSIRYIVVLALAVVVAITAYQAYWLVDIYGQLERRLHDDIDEAMRVSDFEEMLHRIGQLRQEGKRGMMYVRTGMDYRRGQVVVENETREWRNPDDTVVQWIRLNPDFNEALSSRGDVIEVGRYLQRAIHVSLDHLKATDARRYHTYLARRLDSLHLPGMHQLLYLRGERDTLLSIGTTSTPADTFRLKLNPETGTQYLLLLPHSPRPVLYQMRSTLLFSLTTLLLLCVVMVYLVRVIRSQKVLDEIKTDFTNNMTHELKSPIAVAYAATDALLHYSAANDKEKTRRYLNICQEQLRTLTHLVEQILSASMEHRKTLHLLREPIDVAAVVDRCMATARLKAHKPITTHIDIAPGLTLAADPTHFAHALGNLIDNAIKYSGEALLLTISASQGAHGALTISVTDNGIGISREQQRRVFDRFYRVPQGNRHDVKGYGLGLYYVRDIMERMNGTVTLQSQLGKGSTFTLIFYGQD